MLLSRNLPIDASVPYLNKLRANTRYFQIGSIAPDLPYVGIIDNNFLESDIDLANLFHFTTPNQNNRNRDPYPNKIPLIGLELLKNSIQRDVGRRECDALFWFLVGFASHIIADGVCHPFVMDKVGRYEGDNIISHMVLEMGIDVLLLKHFAADNGHAVEASYARIGRFTRGFSELRYTPFILTEFADLIKSVYAYEVTPEKITDWIFGMSRLFCPSTGKWPDWLRNVDVSVPFVFKEIIDIEVRQDDYLVLEKPTYWDQNFLGIQSIHFLNDCLPRFNQLMKSFLDKAYNYIYKAEAQVNESDLPAFSLDTGRSVIDPDNIKLTPVLWEET